MKIAIIGATGTAGRAATRTARQAGYDVITLSRATGIDLHTGEGLTSALDGADVAIDTSNPFPVSADADLVATFRDATARVVRACQHAGVDRLVHLSICNIDDPAFDRAVYDVKPGFTCNIRLASDIAPFIEEKLMNVPLSAVFGDSENKNTYVWVVKDNRVSRREVTVYSPTGEANLLISKGLKPDETVVIAGVYQLVEGQRVKEVE